MANPTTNDTGIPIGITSIGLPSVGSNEERPDADFTTLSKVAGVLRVMVTELRCWGQEGTGPRFFTFERPLVTVDGDLNPLAEEHKPAPGPRSS